MNAMIRVGNNSTLGYDGIPVSTQCMAFVEIHIPKDKDTYTVIELDAAQLLEFLIRTKPEFLMQIKFPTSK